MVATSHGCSDSVFALQRRGGKWGINWMCSLTFHNSNQTIVHTHQLKTQLTHTHLKKKTAHSPEMAA